MSSQKLIMESWRDWVSKTFSGLEDPRLYEDLALMTSVSSYGFLIVLYLPQKMKDEKAVISKKHPPNVVSMLKLGNLSTSKAPCIPNTWQVKNVATKKEYQGKGLGTLIYNLAATYAKLSGDDGITSDHEDMTTKDGSRRWNKIDQSSNFKKKKTAKGSDTFDYTGKETPNDNQDDCVRPKSSKVAVDHSYEIIDGTEDEIKRLKANHKRYIDHLKSMSVADFNQLLLDQAIDIFSTNFTGNM